MRVGSAYLQPCKPRSTPFRPAVRCQRSNHPLPSATCHAQRCGIIRCGMQQTGQQNKCTSSSAVAVPLLSAAAAVNLLQPQAAWSAAVHTELPHVMAIYELADLDAKTAGAIARVVQPLLAVTQLFMIVRIVLSWYPQVNGQKLPWSAAVKPTEWVLGPTRRLIPPVGGVDISPIIWFAFLSFSNEILVGPQGILNLLQHKIS